MKPLPKTTEAALPDLHQLTEADKEVDLTRICWTQVLRTTPELVGPRKPFEPLPDDFSF